MLAVVIQAPGNIFMKNRYKDRAIKLRGEAGRPFATAEVLQNSPNGKIWFIVSSVLFMLAGPRRIFFSAI